MLWRKQVLHLPQNLKLSVSNGCLARLQSFGLCRISHGLCGGNLLCLVSGLVINRSFTGADFRQCGINPIKRRVKLLDGRLIGCTLNLLQCRIAPFACVCSLRGGYLPRYPPPHNKSLIDIRSFSTRRVNCFPGCSRKNRPTIG